MKKQLAVCVLLCVSAVAYGATAGELDSSCYPGKDYKITKTDKKTNKTIWSKTESGDATSTVFSSGQCIGYIQGVVEGENGMVNLFDGKFFVLTFEHNIDYYDVAKTLHAHLEQTPLDKNKPADVVLFQLLRASNLVTGKDVTPAVAPQVTSN
jgi:hypothetical protein